jgi:hypothetical protein
MPGIDACAEVCCVINLHHEASPLRHLRWDPDRLDDLTMGVDPGSFDEMPRLVATSGYWKVSDPLDGVEVRSMALAGLDRVPLAHLVLEPTPPFDQERTVLGVAGPILGLDQPEATPRGQAERLGVIVHECQPAIGVGQRPKHVYRSGPL